MAVIV